MENIDLRRDRVSNESITLLLTVSKPDGITQNDVRRALIAFYCEQQVRATSEYAASDIY